MAIAEVIKFEGPQDALVWKFPIEDFNATSQLIVDETHEALLVVNGNAADLFTAGRRTLSVPNIPIARTLIEIPTGGNSPFPCKVFFINKVHAMDLLWGTQGPIALEDPLYDIFMHVMANGSMSVSVENSRKFMLKIVGFRDRFTPDDLIAKFRGIISSHVKDCISKIMINGMLSYFMMNAHLFELSGVIKERLDNGDFSDPYQKPDFTELMQGNGVDTVDTSVQNIPTDVKEADTVEATDVVADVPQDIDYDAVYSGLDSYDFDGIDYSSDVDRLDSSLENFQDGAWENLSVDEQKAAMSDLADYVKDVIC